MRCQPAGYRNETPRAALLKDLVGTVNAGVGLEEVEAVVALVVLLAQPASSRTAARMARAGFTG